MKSLLPEIVLLAKQAGDAILTVYRSGDFGATAKADASPLTLADLAAHRTIVAGLHKLTPDIPILSEEDSNIPYSVRSQWTRFWLVDPLDGTKEFIKRNGEFTVNIALVEKGVPVMGVVYAPVLDTCYYAARGMGAFKLCGSGFNPTSRTEVRPTEIPCFNPTSRTEVRPTSLHVATPVPGEPIKVVASRSHSDARTQALLDKLDNYECISMGSSLKLCLVAEGAAHFYPRLGPTMEWDTAAAHAVVNAAGGVVQDSNGDPLIYNKPDLHNPEFFVHAATRLYPTD